MIAETQNPLAITDLALVKQKVSFASFEFEVGGLDDHLHRMRDRGLDYWQCTVIYFHTHPAIGASPSGLDDDIFEKAFCNRGLPGCCPPWAGQFIRSRTGENHFMLAFNPEFGPQAKITCPVVIDPSIPIKSTDEAAWEEEFTALVSEKPIPIRWVSAGNSGKERSSFFDKEVGSGNEPGSDLDYVPARLRRKTLDDLRQSDLDKLDHLFDKDPDSELFLPREIINKRKVLEDSDNPEVYRDGN